MSDVEGQSPTLLDRALDYPGIWLGVAVVLSFVHFLRLYDPNLPVLTDTRYFTYFATLVADGGVPHLDFFDNKTQLASMAGGWLVALGRVFGGDDLASIRLGYLSLAALGGVLVFLLFRDIGRGDSLVALLGLMPYLGFTYIGALPATGNVPKLIMAVAATGAALAVARRRWLLAGVVAAIAPLDWQMGLFACIGVFLAALMDQDRRRAAVLTIIGGVSVAALFILYYAANGALEPLLSQAITASLVRGASEGGPLIDLSGIALRLSWHAPSEAWLVALSFPGMALLLIWLAGARMRSLRGPLTVMAVYHFGIVGFSLLDFQGGGDTMLLLHSLAFFAGVTLIAVNQAIARLPLTASRSLAGRVVWLALIVALVRPAIARPAVQSTPDVPVGVTLYDQMRFVRQLEPVLRGKRLVMLGPSELLMLGDFTHESIFVFWNPAAAFEFQRQRGERFEDPLAAFIEYYDPDVIIANRFFALPEGIPYVLANTGDPGGYAVKLLLREDGPK